jgi:hypothetical protein
MSPEEASALIRQIAAMAEPLGPRLYRGLLKTAARAWNPAEIRDSDVLRRVLVHMQAAERGLRRLDAALDITGPEVLVRILEALKLRSLDRVDNLDALKQIVLKLEQAAADVKR